MNWKRLIVPLPGHALICVVYGFPTGGFVSEAGSSCSLWECGSLQVYRDIKNKNQKGGETVWQY